MSPCSVWPDLRERLLILVTVEMSHGRQFIRSGDGGNPIVFMDAESVVDAFCNGDDIWCV